jgi:multiple sugar transport system ATP-binding protein
MVSVKLENVTKKFGNIIAVNKLNLDIKDGEFVCLLGPSGCGKTTTLRCIAGLDNFTEGNIYFNGEVINHLPPQQRNIGMVFQFYVVYRMSVRENLAFPLEIKKLPRTEIEYKVKEIAEILKIDHLLDVKATKLGPADKQRVALGRALVKEPRVLLLDEPLTNLDAKLRAEMRIELKKLHEKLRTTTIYVTHDQIEAMSLGDRIAVMNLGVLQQYDTPYNLYYHPKNLFVASFIGSPSMNFIDCSLVEKSDGIYLDAGSFQVKLVEEGEFVKHNATSSDLILGIRPEHITLKKNPDDAYEAMVDLVENIGDRYIIHLKSGDHIIKVITDEKLLNPGDKTYFSFDRKKMHVIDKKTERVII